MQQVVANKLIRILLLSYFIIRHAVINGKYYIITIKLMDFR